MKGYTEQKCRYHFIVENEFESYKNHILEIANFADHPMLKTISKIDDVFCPVFFKEGRSETELSYVSMQTDMFDHCLSDLLNTASTNRLKSITSRYWGTSSKFFTDFCLKMSFLILYMHQIFSKKTARSRARLTSL